MGLGFVGEICRNCVAKSRLKRESGLEGKDFEREKEKEREREY